MNDRTDNAQRLSKTRFFGALIFTGVGLTFCFFLFVGKPVTQPEKLPEIRRPLVDTVVAKPSKHRVTVRTQGTVEPVREIDLFAQVSGQVESVADYFRDGLFFSAGDILLELEKADYEFAILRAKAQVATATQRVAEERGRNLQAQREWQELDTHQANDLFLRRPQVRAAEAALEAALADVAAAELALERTTIRAPFNGRLERTVVDLGQFVATGSLLAEIYATDRVEIRLPVNDSQLRLLELPLFETRSKPYPQVTLSYKFGGETWRWRGEISRVEARIDTNSRVTFANAEVTNPFERHEDYFLPLTPGLFVNATIE
jgi:RND family efflux transporter MFP subunit